MIRFVKTRDKIKEQQAIEFEIHNFSKQQDKFRKAYVLKVAWCNFQDKSFEIIGLSR